ncbi:MAG: winged helix-turn-helix domain-containing protein [Halobacteriales archaeon]
MAHSDEQTSAELDPQAAFGLFSHELRLEILQALWEAADFSLPFSDLREEVGERDSGKFTYHLSKLEDQFVKQVDGRYTLQYAGHRVIDAVQSGVFHESPIVEPTEIEGHCTACGGQPQFSYENHLATVTCEACTSKLIEYPFDPGGFRDRTIREATQAFDRRTKYKWRLASDGVCFVCAGSVETAFTETPPAFDHMDRYDNYFADDHPAIIELSCRNCSFYSYLPVGVRLLNHPTVISQLGGTDIDIRDRPLWSLPFITEADCLTVESADPWTVHVEAPDAGGPIDVALNRDVEIESVTVTV